MVEMKIKYMGDKHCELLHVQSNSVIETDAPKDNQGRGEKFSPTDLLGASLGSCILTTMDILGGKQGINVLGSTAKVIKEMTPAPRRVASLSVELTLPRNLDESQRRILEEIARTCPVHRSLHPDVQIPILFRYELEN